MTKKRTPKQLIDALQKARSDYRDIRDRVLWSAGGERAEFDGRAAKLVSLVETTTGKREPKQWVEAAKHVRMACRRCAETGRFITHVVNGVPRGPGGRCYRCDGKGYQNHEDAKRNDNYETHGRRVTA